MVTSSVDLCNHGDLFDDLVKISRENKGPSYKRLCTRFQLHLDKEGIKARKRGDLLLEEFEMLLADFDKGSFARSSRQREWHRGIMSVLTHIFYEDDLDNNREKLCRKFELDYLCAFMRIVAARRQGKTVAINQTIVSLMLLGLPIEIVMFSTGRRLSSENLKGILRFLQYVEPDIGSRIEACNEEKLHVWNKDRTVLTKLSCVPSSVEISTIYFFVYVCVNVSCTGNTKISPNF